MNLVIGRLFCIHVYIKAINTSKPTSMAIVNAIDMDNDQKRYNVG